MDEEGGEKVASPPSLTIGENGKVVEGHLKKQGRKMKFLTRYYFRLDPNQKSLTYLTSKTAKTEKATVYLGRYTIDDLGNKEKNHFFKISTPTKVLVLAAESESEKLNWIESLQLSIPSTPSASIYREHSTILR